MTKKRVKKPTPPTPLAMAQKVWRDWGEKPAGFVTKEMVKDLSPQYFEAEIEADELVDLMTFPEFVEYTSKYLQKNVDGSIAVWWVITSTRSRRMVWRNTLRKVAQTIEGWWLEMAFEEIATKFSPREAFTPAGATTPYIAADVFEIRYLIPLVRDEKLYTKINEQGLTVYAINPLYQHRSTHPILGQGLK